MKNNQKLIIAIVCVCCIWLIISIIVIVTKKEEFKPVLQSDITSIEALCSYYNIEYISEEDISDFEFIKQVFLKFPYDTQNQNGTSSRNYYEDVIYSLAKVYKYKDIIVLDDEKALKIEIESDENSETVDSYVINGDKNYFTNLEAKLNLAQITDIQLKEMNVESNILKNLIENNWNENSVNFGAKDSNLKDYEIYFDEGIQVRKIAGKIFNVVFTEKYANNIVDNISVKTDFSEIKAKYGMSSFEETGSLLGYKTKDFYIFFSSGQVSIYRIDTYETKEFADLVTTFIETKDETKFTNDLKSLWPDYDYFSQDERLGTIELTYTLKGVKFNINMSREQGITLYSNFNGQIINDTTFEQILSKEKEIPNYVYAKSEDLVFLNEIERAYGIYNNSMLEQEYLYRYEDSKDKELDIYYDNTQSDFAKRSSEFFCLKDGSTLRVFSFGNIYPPIEIKNNYCFLWADNTHLLYSINKQGIYMYDAVSRNIKTIVEGDGAYKIKSYEKGILKYDNENIECNIN